MSGPGASPISVSDGSAPRRRLAWLVLLLTLALTGAVRWRLLDAPLQRDEGEYAYAGQLILQGLAPYQHVYNMKLPGAYGAYALIMGLFGQTPRGIHLGLLAVNAATVLLMYHLGRRLCGVAGGAAAAAAFGVLALGQSLYGLCATAEHFVVLAAVSGLLLLLRGTRRDDRATLVLAGLLLGLAPLMKQHGAAFTAIGGLYLVWRAVRRRSWRREGMHAVVYALAAAAPLLLTALLFRGLGLFERFWFWTFAYARAYGSQIPPGMAPRVFGTNAAAVITPALSIWLLAAAGGVALLCGRSGQRAGRHRGLLALLLGGSLLAICPGFFFRPHYFVMLLPVVALLAGAAVAAARCRLIAAPALPRGLAACALCALLVAPLFVQRDFLFRQGPTESVRSTFGANPFPESVEIARFIQANSVPADRIAVLGSEPQIGFYAQRRLATGYVYTYPLMEEHDLAARMQVEMLQEIEAADPKFVVFVHVATSWLKRSGSDDRLTGWLDRFGQDRYVLVGLVDIHADGTRYHWHPQVAWPPRSDQWLAVLMRTAPAAAAPMAAAAEDGM